MNLDSPFFFLFLFCLSLLSLILRLVRSTNRCIYPPSLFPFPFPSPHPKIEHQKKVNPRFRVLPAVLAYYQGPGASLYRPTDSACVESCNVCGWRRRGSNRGRGTVHAGEMPHQHAPSRIPPTRRSSFTVVPLCWNSGGRANGTILFLFPGWARRAPLRNLARDTPPDLFGAGSSMRDLCLTKYPLTTQARQDIMYVHTVRSVPSICDHGPAGEYLA